ETSQVFYSSKDGTRIPMFLTRKRGLKNDAANPALLYGYGGFNISVTPSFSVSKLVWLEMGGTYAVANLRGGGEYGEDWHRAVMDMLRFHKFTIGWAWTSDYGSADDPAQFKAIYAYSPLQNLKPGTKYPATLITTADHDDRVVPAHSFKFAARMQECQAGDAPVLIRIETRAGHGAGKPTAKMIDEAADELGFLLHELKFRPKIL